MKTIVEFPAIVRRIDIEGFLRIFPSIKFDFQQSDNLHHKYLVESNYADDFVAVGIYIGRLDWQTVHSDSSLSSE